MAHSLIRTVICKEMSSELQILISKNSFRWLPRNVNKMFPDLKLEFQSKAPHCIAAPASDVHENAAPAAHILLFPH